MPLRGIVYVSKANQIFGHAELSTLEARSQQRNEEIGVTGYLYFEEGYFFQYIEGEFAAVTELLNRIEADDRHTIERFVYDDSLLVRRFGGWSMRFLFRKDFYGLESLLLDHIRFMKSWTSSENQGGNSLVWRLIDRISSLQQRLTARAI